MIMRSRRRGLIALLCMVLLCAGCKVDANTTIQLNRDGSGTVSVRITLDRQAVSLIQSGGGTLEKRVVLTDLKTHGWKVSAWQRQSGGSAAITLSHPFQNGAELTQVLTDLTGKNGVLREARLTRTRNVFESQDGVSVTADLGKLRSGVRNDKELASRLKAAGINVDQVDFVLGSQLQDAFTLGVTLGIPSGQTTTAHLTSGQSDTVAVSTSKVQWNRIMLAGIGGMLVFLALLLYLSATISAHRRRSRELDFAARRAGRMSEPLM
jgi:hypothetical protein